jgi:hypothetical protein
MKRFPFFFLLFSLTFVKNALLAQSVVANEAINVLYVGVENPLTIIAQGVPPEALEVKISEGTITKAANSATDYIAKVNKAGKVKIETWHQGKQLETMEFRVKRIPDPYTMLYSDYNSNSVCIRAMKGKASLLASGGLVAVLEGFNFDVKCSIVSFEITHTIPKEDPVTLLNIGADFTSVVKAEIAKSKPGHVIYLDKVKAKCPGDMEGRIINSKVFKIK